MKFCRWEWGREGVVWLSSDGGGQGVAWENGLISGLVCNDFGFRVSSIAASWLTERETRSFVWLLGSSGAAGKSTGSSPQDARLHGIIVGRTGTISAPSRR